MFAGAAGPLPRWRSTPDPQRATLTRHDEWGSPFPKPHHGRASASVRSHRREKPNRRAIRSSALPGAATRSGTPPSQRQRRVPHRIASRPPASAARVRPARRERLSAHRPAVLCPNSEQDRFFHGPRARSCSGYLASPHRPSGAGCPGPCFAGRRFLATCLGLDGVGGWPARARAHRRVGAVPPRKKPIRSGR